MRARFSWTALAALGLLFSRTAFAQEPTKAEIAKQAKAATALVEVARGFKHGSAFCLHDSGLFLTNEHVVRGAGEVKLVLHPGLNNQKIIRAKVIRLDKNLELALLRTIEMADLTPLKLGSSQGLAELAEVIAVGFPFGKSLALGKDEYPAVSVNAGRVTALRLKKGELERIQMDAVVNPGNSGGPVLDAKGKVVGVVVSGVLGATVNFAIPVSHVQKFVAVPEVEVLFPSIAYADRYKPAVFQVRAVALVPSPDAFQVELTLAAKGAKPRQFKMNLEDGLYRAVAEALRPPSSSAVRITLTYPAGSLHGVSNDQTFKIGGFETRLSELRSMRFGSEPTAILASGKVLTGALSGLETLAIELGTDTVKLNPHKASDVTIHPQAEEASVPYTIVVRQGAKEVARLQNALGFSGVPTPSLGEVVKIGIAPPVLDRDATVYKLPSPAGDVVVGGGGRFLIIQFPKDKALGIFDVSQAKIVKIIPLAEDHVRFAAGMDKLVIAYPNSGVFQRYNLNSLERETVKKVELGGKIHFLGLGHASNGPLFVAGPQGPGDENKVMATILDLDFKVMPVQMRGRHAIGFSDATNRLRASANGRVFTTWGFYTVQSMVVDGLECNIYLGGLGEDRCVSPSHDGNVLYSTGRGAFTWQGKEIDGTRKGPRQAAVPAHGYPYYLSFPDKGIAVHLGGDDRVVAALPHVDEKRENVDFWGRDTWTPDKRYHFIPDAKVIIELPHPNDRLILHRFDMDQALAKANFDYLFVTSSPPLAVRRGEALSYAVTVKSKHAGVTYKLVNAPDGMTISPAGQIAWQVPMSFEGSEVDVLASIENSARQEIFHSFKLAVRR